MIHSRLSRVDRMKIRSSMKIRSVVDQAIREVSKASIMTLDWMMRVTATLEPKESLLDQMRMVESARSNRSIDSLTYLLVFVTADSHGLLSLKGWKVY